MLNHRSLLAVTLFALAGPAPGLTQQPVATTPGTQVRGQRLAPSHQLSLSLREATVMALEHNLNLEISRLNLASASQGVLAASGVFDPFVRLDFVESSSESPATNQLVGAQVNKQDRRSFNINFGALLPTGGEAALGWNNTRNKTNSTFFFLNPSYNSSLTFSFTQPLLRSFGTDVNRARIEIARRNRHLNLLDFEKLVINTVQQVESAYWNLVYARENLKVKQQSLKLAQDLLEQTRIRVRVGTSAPIDIVQSEATVAAREQDIILAENAVQAAADNLKILLGFEDPQDFLAEIVPTDSLQAMTERVDFQQAVQIALERRPELKSRVLQTEIVQENLLLARSALLPQLDLGINYGFVGVGGTFTQRDPRTGQVVSVVPGNWDDALRQIRDRDFAQWSATLTFSYSLGNNQAKALLAQRRYELAAAQQALAVQRQAVIAEVRAAVRNLEASAKAIEAAVKARQLAERNLEAELKKFENGMSTNYQVLQIQEDLAAAQVAELQARVAYRQSMVGYQVAVGTLLETMGIQLADTLPEPEVHTYWKDVPFLKLSYYTSAGS
ncbi:MAG: TolC family protein [Thermoanaerobaculum sp.]|nr:TolC family protein [Thermoanaerobaculum sp.]MDW7967629.1 TolC family protein [Thermoanaerobaculum sp.]